MLIADHYLRPMDADFRLKVFYAAASKLNFTKAANDLFITQPAVTKNIKELEQQTGVTLFERNGGRLILTEAGEILKEHAKKILDQYNQADYALSILNGKESGLLKLGASTTISQYVIPTILAQFHARHPGIQLQLVNGNTEQIEKGLLDKEIDLAITEGSASNHSIKYIPFLKDEIVLVTATSNCTTPQVEDYNELKKLPLVMRENGSGTLEIIEQCLKEKNIHLQELDIKMQLGSSESIKEFLLHSNYYAFLSVHAITRYLQDGSLTIIDIADMDIHRKFYFAHMYGTLSALPNLFMKFAFQQQSHT